MPWEVTIRRADGTPLGDMEAVRNQIAAARAAGREFPDLIRRHMERRPATMQAVFNDDGCSLLLYRFEAQPLGAIHVEVRGGGNPVPVLAALCRPNGWVVVDDASGEPVELSGVAAAGWTSAGSARSSSRPTGTRTTDSAF